jgi:hypothetical protein
MKKIFILIGILMISHNISSKEIPLSHSDSLVGKNFEYRFIIGESNLHFYKNNKYEMEFGSEGWYWYNEGVYEIKNGKIYFSPAACLDRKDGQPLDCAKTMGSAVGSLSSDEKSLWYEQVLNVVSDNNKDVFSDYEGQGSVQLNYIDYNILESKVKEGAKRSIDGIPVIAMGLKKGISTDDVKIRKKPSVESESVKFQAGLYAEEAEEKNFVPKNTEIIIIARSVNKEKVKNWNNYWYYIKVGMNDGVWAFAEFIKIK